MLPLLLISAVALGAWFVYFPWHKSIHDLLLMLNEGDAPHETCDADISVGELKKRIEGLPKPVQKYFKKVYNDAKHSSEEDTIPFARSLRMEQEGEFLLNGKLIPFTATQEFRCRIEHAGFVWNASMEAAGSCMPNIHVCDAYVNGSGTMKATMAGVPVINAKPKTPELNLGELMRWAAEAPLFPLALLPTTETKEGTAEQDPTLKWLPAEDGDDNAAVLELDMHNMTTRMTFYFDPETHLINSLKAVRPKGVGPKSVMTNWEGFYHDYQHHCSLLVPTRMEVGWQVDDEPLEIYFKGINKHLVYLTNHHGHLPRKPRHAHTD